MMNDSHRSVRDTIVQTVKKTSRGWLKLCLIGAVIMLSVAAAIAAIKVHAAADSPHYQTKPVERGNLKITVSATGNLEATNQVDVGSELSGIVTSVMVDFNDTVTRGQPLAYLDDSKLQASVLKSRAEVASSKASLQEKQVTKKEAEQNLERYLKTRELTGGKLPSLENLEQAEADLERAAAAVCAAEAAIEAAEASLKINETDLEKTVIYASINGIVLSRDIEPGQTVAASLQAPVLFTLAENLRSMELQVDVDEADVGKVREGQKAVFTVDAYPDQTFNAEITQVRFGAETTDGVVTYKTVLKVDNPQLLLRPGMTATADIIVQNVEGTFLVPNTALRFNPVVTEIAVQEKRSFIDSLLPGPPRRNARQSTGENSNSKDTTTTLWKLGEGGRPEAIAVERVATDGALTAVKSPHIQEGMQVITNELMTDG